MQSIKIHIKHLHLQNYRGFTDFDVNFDDEITIFIGENGAGKSAIIDVVSEALKRLINKIILKEDYFTNVLDIYDIKNGTDNLAITIKFGVYFPDDFPYVYIQNFETTIHKFKEKYENIIKEKNSDFWEEFLDINFEKKDDSGKLYTIIEKFQNDDLDFDADLLLDLDKIKNEFEDNILAESDVEIELKLELNKKSESPTLIIENREEYDKLIYAFKYYEEWEDAFPVFLDFGSGHINIGSEQFSYKNNLFEKKHAIYKEAFTNERFSIKDFIIWFDSLYKIYLQNPDDNEEFAHKKIQIINDAVCNALSIDTPDKYSGLKMKYDKNNANLIIKKHISKQETIDIAVKQLSSGEKALLALVGDIARRAIMANPIKTKLIDNSIVYSEPLKDAQGIILIDEIDLHLHPKWQRNILPILTSIFPNIQFIITTHSPFVVQNIKFTEKSKLIILPENKTNIQYKGRQIERMLIDIFNIEKLRPDFVKFKFKEIYDLIDENNLEEAQRKLDNLKIELTNNDDEIITIETLIEFKNLPND